MADGDDLTFECDVNDQAAGVVIQTGDRLNAVQPQQIRTSHPKRPQVASSRLEGRESNP
jgi:hypothetical protein